MAHSRLSPSRRAKKKKKNINTGLPPHHVLIGQEPEDNNGTKMNGLAFLVLAALCAHAQAFPLACNIPDWTVSVAIPSTDYVEDNQVFAAVSAAIDQSNHELRQLGMSTLVLDSTPLQTRASSFYAINGTVGRAQRSSLTAIVGMAASSTVRASAPIAGAAGVALLSPWAQDVDLTKSLFPGLFRLRPGNFYLPQTIRDLVLHYRWPEVAFLYSSETYGSRLPWDVRQELKSQGVSVSVFNDVSLVGAKKAVKTIKSAGKKLVVVTVSVQELSSVLREASHLKMVEQGYGWIVAPLQIDPKLLSEEMRTNLAGALVIQEQLNTATLSKFTVHMQKQRPNTFPQRYPGNSRILVLTPGRGSPRKSSHTLGKPNTVQRQCRKWFFGSRKRKHPWSPPRQHAVLDSSNAEIQQQHHWAG